jgi:phytol kinase
MLMVNLLAGFLIPDWIWDIIALVITFVLIMLLIRINDVLRKRETIPIYVSRKVIHTFAGPLFLVCWLLFSNAIYSRYLAAVVPIIFVLLFAGIGSGAIKNEEFVRTMSRSGKASELLKGTLFYALVMVVSSILMWYVPVNGAGVPQYAIFVPTVFLIFGPLAGGDGCADMVGRKWGKHKYKVFAEKSVEGSLAMFFFSILFTYGLLGIYWLVLNPVYPAAISLIKPLIPILIVSLVATIVEAISPKNVDNLLIPIVSFIVIYILALPMVGLYPYLVWNFFPVS